MVLRLQQRDLLTLGEGQVAASWFLEADRAHPASVAKPARRNRRGHADLDTGVLAGLPFSDQTPEGTLHRSRRLRSPR